MQYLCALSLTKSWHTEKPEGRSDSCHRLRYSTYCITYALLSCKLCFHVVQQRRQRVEDTTPPFPFHSSLQWLSLTKMCFIFVNYSSFGFFYQSPLFLRYVLHFRELYWSKYILSNHLTVSVNLQSRNVWNIFVN